jgi:hypothetical protein
MPSKHPLSEIEKDYLKKVCELKVGFPITDTYACIQLSGSILEKTGKTISYNTLRRMLGIIKTKNSPSGYSLNLLAHFLGFDHWDSFILYLQKQENEQFLIKNHSLIYFGIWDQGWTHGFLKGLNQVEWQDAFKLKSLVQAALNRRDKGLLLTLTNLPVNPLDISSLQRLSLSFEPVIWEAIQGDTLYWEWIGDALLQRPIFRKVILEFYVNEDALDGYFGYWLNLPYDQVSDEFVLFRKLLNGQAAYQKAEQTTAFEAEICQILDQELWKDHHPILRGRIAAWGVLFEKLGKSKLAEMCDSCENWYGKAAFTTFFYRLFWKSKGLQTFENWNWRESSPNLGMLSTFEFSQWNNYLMVQAVFAQITQNFLDCEKHFTQIDKFLFAFDSMNWFYRQYETCEKFLREYKEQSKKS